MALNMGRLGGATLSPQQARCIELVGEGLTTKEIAFALGLSDNTVDEHIKKAMFKLGAPNRVRAAALYRGALNAAAQPLTAKIVDAQQSNYPQWLGGGTHPVGPDDNLGASETSTLRLKDGERVPFEAQPPPSSPPGQPSEPEPGRDADLLTIMSKIIAIAGALALILTAAPGLVASAERIAAWLRSSANVHP